MPSDLRFEDLSGCQRDLLLAAADPDVDNYVTALLRAVLERRGVATITDRAVYENVRELRKKDLLTATSGTPSDGRRTYIELTPDGREALRDHQARVERCVDSLNPNVATDGGHSQGILKQIREAEEWDFEDDELRQRLNERAAELEAELEDSVAAGGGGYDA